MCNTDWEFSFAASESSKNNGVNTDNKVNIANIHTSNNSKNNTSINTDGNNKNDTNVNIGSDNGKNDTSIDIFTDKGKNNIIGILSDEDVEHDIHSITKCLMRLKTLRNLKIHINQLSELVFLFVPGLKDSFVPLFAYLDYFVAFVTFVISDLAQLNNLIFEITYWPILMLKISSEIETQRLLNY